MQESIWYLGVDQLSNTTLHNITDSTKRQVPHVDPTALIMKYQNNKTEKY